MISIVVSSYNRLRHLKLFLQCCREQTYKDFEIVVADDGSSDGTIEYLDKTKNKCFFDLDYVTQKDLGFRKSKILNKAIGKTKFDDILFLDADLLIGPRFVSNYLEVYEKFKGCLISGKIGRINQKDSLKITEELIKSDFDKIVLMSSGLEPENTCYRDDYTGYCDSPFKRSFWHHWVLGGNFICPKKIIYELNGFDEDFIGWGGEDNDFAQRISLSGKCKIVLSGVLVAYHLYHSMVGDRSGQRLFNEKKKFEKTIVRNEGRNVFN